MAPVARSSAHVSHVTTALQYCHPGAVSCAVPCDDHIVYQNNFNKLKSWKSRDELGNLVRTLESNTRVEHSTHILLQVGVQSHPIAYFCLVAIALIVALLSQWLARSDVIV